MIGYLEGVVKEKINNKIILLCGGVGFEITCSASVYNACNINENTSAYIYTAVREDDISLYGFISSSEKEMFLKLISVSGVGPKMGITVLSNMKLEELAVKIATSDVKGLSKVKGLGKKTAERIILELREKITAEETGDEEITVETAKTETLTPEQEDAIIALMGLGFTRQECVNAMSGAFESGAKTIQEIVTYALKHIR